MRHLVNKHEISHSLAFISFESMKIGFNVKPQLLFCEAMRYSSVAWRSHAAESAVGKSKFLFLSYANHSSRNWLYRKIFSLSRFWLYFAIEIVLAEFWAIANGFPNSVAVEVSERIKVVLLHGDSCTCFLVLFVTNGDETNSRTEIALCDRKFRINSKYKI